VLFLPSNPDFVFIETNRVASNREYSLLLTRQDELPEDLCYAPCDIGTCNAGSCTVGITLNARSLSNLTTTNESGHQRTKRAFSNENPTTYIPAVYRDDSSDYDYFGLAMDFQDVRRING
jgi:hypothetical protein